MGLRGWLFGRINESSHLEQSAAGVAEHGDDLWKILRYLRRSPDDMVKGFTADEKVELLARLVANLIDEVELLRQFIAKAPSRFGQDDPCELHRLDQTFAQRRMNLLFSSAGCPGPPIEKLVPYLRSPLDWAKELIPDEKERIRTIASLHVLT